MSARLAAVLERMYADLMLQKEEKSLNCSKNGPTGALADNSACKDTCTPEYTHVCDVLTAVLKELLIIWRAGQKKD